VAARQRFNFKLGWVFKNPVLTIGGHLDKPQIRVLLVDDFYPFRRYLSSTLRKRADVRVIGEAADGLEAVKQVKQLVPDLVLLDIGLPRQNGIDAARQIRTVCPNTKIIFVSQESSRELVEEALALGAKGYLVKSALAMELMAALDAVIGGEWFVSRECEEHHGKSPSKASPQILERAEVLRFRRVNAP